MSRKRVTSHDVARQAGVSRSVVSAVINGTKGIRLSEETRAVVQKAIEDLNYHVDAQARGMKTGRSGCLAAFGDMRDPLFLQLLEGMQKSCAAHGYDILISGQSALRQSRSELIPLYLQRRIDGIVTLDKTSYCDEMWAVEVRQAGVPYVSVEGYAEHSGIWSVQADYYQSILDALDYLARDGRPSPVYVEVHLGEERENWAERSRRAAYEAWCASRGVPPVIHTLPATEEGRMLDLIGSLSRQASSPLTLLLNWAYSAAVVYKAALKLGLSMGRDLLFMTADNTYRTHRHMVPSLSCMEIPYAAMGEAAVLGVLEQLEQPEQPVRKRQCPAVLLPGESG